METEAISCCIGPLSRDYLSKLVHHVAPCTNLHKVLPYKTEEDDISELLAKPFPYASTVPVPLTPLAAVERSTVNGLDSTMSLIREKIKWQTKKEKILKAVKKDSRNIKSKLLEQALKVPINGTATLPRGVALLAQHLDKDPDRRFTGAYNWYYTGGTLATLNFEEEFYLLDASHSTLNCSKVLDNEDCLLLSSVNVGEKHNERIYQVLSNMKGAAVRQKSQVTILAPFDTGDKYIKLDSVLSVTGKKPILSAALEYGSLRTFCTLASGGGLKVWDVEYAKPIKKGMLNKQKTVIGTEDAVSVSDSWSMIHYLDNNTLLLADRCCLRQLDLRANLGQVQHTWCPRNMLESCEQLSYVTPSSVRDYITYALTTHQALSLDLRLGFYSQRWTHMMTSPPYIGFAQLMPNNQEVLCLGSQVGADCVVIVNSLQGEDPESLYNPSILPSPTCGLHLARQQGLCLDPTLTQRCTQSQTGITYLPAYNGNYIVRQTATGDVFIQHLTTVDDADDTKLTDRQLSAYANWSCPTLPLQRGSITVKVTDVADLTDLATVLSSPEMPMDRKRQHGGLNYTGSSWQLSKKYMEDCVDLLAGKMLEVWDVEEEEEWAPEVKDESQFEEQDPKQKVTDWLVNANPLNTTVNITGMKPIETSTPFLRPEKLVDSHPLQLTSLTASNANTNTTALRSQRPAIASTPFLPAQPSFTKSPQEDEAWPWMTQLSQQTPHKLSGMYFPSAHQSTPPSSGGSSKQARKRQKLFHSNSPKKPASAKKPVRSVKKSVPGF